MSEERIEELRARNHDLANQVMQERAKLMQAEADNAALRDAAKPIADQFEATWIRPMLSDEARRLIDVMKAAHPGASLIAELETARADNAALRYLLTESINFRQRCRLCDRAAPNHEPDCPLAGEHPSTALIAVAQAAVAFVEADEYDDLASLLLELKAAVKGWKR